MTDQGLQNSFKVRGLWPPLLNLQARTLTISKLFYNYSYEQQMYLLRQQGKFICCLFVAV